MPLLKDWETAKNLAIKAFDNAIKAAELEEKALPAKAKRPKTEAAKSVRAGFSTACRAVDTCCIAFDKAIKEGNKKLAMQHLNTFKTCWGTHSDSLEKRNAFSSPYIKDELKNIDKWFEKKHKDVKAAEGL